MKVYKSPVYPALMVRLPGDGRRSVKAAGGFFNIQDEDVEAFEAFIASRPHYAITSESGTIEGRRLNGDAPGLTRPPGAEHGIMTQPEPLSESERHPETVSVESLENLNVPTLQERLAGLGLDTKGRKAVLVKRLADATATATGLGDSVTDEADTEDVSDPDAEAGDGNDDDE